MKDRQFYRDNQEELCIEPLDLTVTETAKALGVGRKTLSCIINVKAAPALKWPIRLSIAFDTAAESWMNQQAQYDLWQMEQHRNE